VAEGGISPGVYFATLLSRFVAVLILMVLVIRDILEPGYDLVRVAGDDDPAGGVLDGADDRFVLRQQGAEPVSP
jgi:hypothetical protein